jgi:cytidylate kinase
MGVNVTDRQPTTVLAISRQLGSGGSHIGREVAKRLGFSYVDREILHRAAESLGVDAANLAPLEERGDRFWERLAPPFLLGVTDVPIAPPPQYTAGADLFAAERRIILSIAARGNAVIVGRGGVHVLSGYPGLVAVFVHAPESFRVRRLMQALGVATVQEATELVRRSDKQRSAFHKSLTHRPWAEASIYDVCVNTDTVGLAEATDVIAGIVAARMGALHRREIDG